MGIVLLILGAVIFYQFIMVILSLLNIALHGFWAALIVLILLALITMFPVEAICVMFSLGMAIWILRD